MRNTLLSICVLLFCAACGSRAASTVSAPTQLPAEQTLTVFAAASLTDSFQELAQAFEQANPGVKVTLNFAGSSTLAAQLIEGAQADVFASANMRQMTVVQDAGHIAEPVQVFAHNRLVVAVPGDNPGEITTLHDLARPEVSLVIAAPDVPVRVYTDTFIEALTQNADFGEEWAAAVRENVVSEEADVRQVVAKVALGEVDAGIVYKSDVTPDLADSVMALTIIPDDVNPLATYPVAVIKDSERVGLAETFVAYLLSNAGQTVLAKWGFDPAQAGGEGS